MGRITTSIQYTRSIDSSKYIYIYNGKDSNITWVFRYDNEKNDTILKLWSISSILYGYAFYDKYDIYPDPPDWKILEETYRTMDNDLNERSEYIYKNDGLLDKIVDQQGAYEKYTYEYY